MYVISMLSQYDEYKNVYAASIIADYTRPHAECFIE